MVAIVDLWMQREDTTGQRGSGTGAQGGRCVLRRVGLAYEGLACRRRMQFDPRQSFSLDSHPASDSAFDSARGSGDTQESGKRPSIDQRPDLFTASEITAAAQAMGR